DSHHSGGSTMFESLFGESRLVRNGAILAVAAMALVLEMKLAAQSPGDRAAPARPAQPASPPASIYQPVAIDKSFQEHMAADTAVREQFNQRQQQLLQSRYDLSDNPSGVMMSGGRRAVQQGVRVKLPAGTTWDALAALTPEQIRERNLYPMGFRPLPH